MERIAPADFAVDLGKPADALRVLGTGGLATADKAPGSYMWLAAADPATRAGVVAGWVTSDRGSGVLLPRVEGGRLRLRGADRLRPTSPRARANRAGRDAGRRLLRRRAARPGGVGRRGGQDLRHPPAAPAQRLLHLVSRRRVRRPEAGRADRLRRRTPQALRLLVRPDRRRLAGRREVQRPAQELHPRPPRRPLPRGHEADRRHDPLPRPHRRPVADALRRYVRRPVVRRPPGLVRQAGRRLALRRQVGRHGPGHDPPGRQAIRCRQRPPGHPRLGLRLPEDGRALDGQRDRDHVRQRRLQGRPPRRRRPSTTRRRRTSRLSAGG